MKLGERLRRDRETLRSLPRDKRGQFIWDYYKIPIIAVGSALVMAALSLLFNTGRGDVVMYAVLINAQDQPESRAFEELLEERGMDMEGKRVSVAANYTLGQPGGESGDAGTVQVLAALFGIGDLDLFAAGQEIFDSYARQDAFVDISLFVEPEVLAAREGDLYRYEDSSGNEIVGGIWLREGSPLHRAGYYTGDVIIGAAAKAENLDAAVETLKALLE